MLPSACRVVAAQLDALGWLCRVALVVALACLGATVAIADVGPEILLSPMPEPDSGERYHPRVSYNSEHDEFLTVWHNTWPGEVRDVYARRVSGRGKKLSWFAVSAGTGDRFLPDVAYNPTDDEFLVVWTFDVNGDGSVYEIWGRILTYPGPGSGTEFVIGNVIDHDAWSPVVVWDRIMKQYMVCWDEILRSSGLAHRIGCRAVHRNGEPGNYNIVSDQAAPHQVDLSFIDGTGRYAVVWRGSGGPVHWAIYAQLIDWSTALVGTRVTVIGSQADARLPTVACDSKDWNEAFCHIYWQYFTSVLNHWVVAATPARAQDLSSVVYYGIGSSELPSLTELQLAYDADRDRFLLVLEEKRGAEPNTRQAAAAIVNPISDFDRMTIQDAVFWNHESPHSAAGGNGDFFVVYTGDDSLTRHVYGRLALNLVFDDDFELGELTRWTLSVP